ncbi:MAG TPA: 30S ribosome-binding factor RbfA [Candidatus Limnocylindrales bacterium]|nr:30S ribosome-binding factor RbfA [Candidatus Limnocylindrales bacterium]
MTQRTDRIDEQLRQEIGAILAREISDPRIGFATVTDVETVPDLSHAKVWISVIGQPAERRETARALTHALPYIRRQLGSRLHLRRIPELHLELDETAERGTRVLKLIEELEAGRTPDEQVTAGETLPTPVKRIQHEGDA